MWKDDFHSFADVFDDIRIQQQELNIDRFDSLLHHSFAAHSCFGGLAIIEQ